MQWSRVNIQIDILKSCKVKCSTRELCQRAHAAYEHSILTEDSRSRGDKHTYIQLCVCVCVGVCGHIHTCRHTVCVEIDFVLLTGTQFQIVFSKFVLQMFSSSSYKPDNMMSKICVSTETLKLWPINSAAICNFGGFSEQFSSPLGFSRLSSSA